MDNNHFNSRVNFVGIWKIRSEELYRSAKIVWKAEVVDHSDKTNDDADKIHLLYRPASLLMGLSLETLLKGLYLSRSPITDNSEYPEELGKHKLINLFKLLNINFDENEERLLKRLTAAVEWVSKYPIPKKTYKI